MKRTDKKKILIAEDDTSIAEVVSIVLTEEGFLVVVADTKEKILHCIHNNKPDLLLLDIWLSGADGGKIAKELKNNEETKMLPIIIMSAKNDTKQIAIEAGANDFLLKPFDIEELLGMIKKYTHG